MRQQVLKLMVVGMVTAMSAPAFAKPAYVPSTVNLRAGPGTDKEVLGKIPSGSLIDVGACTGGWCAVTWQDKSGFAIETAIDFSGRVPPRRTVRRRYYVEEPPVYYVPPPPVYYTPYYRRHYFGPYWGWRHPW
ncbi:MAG: SH3 domain-containing protein [Proteobacteria bacterium]|nr:SH3 domain-containing protein [Pseudomonadota bacterium]